MGHDESAEEYVARKQARRFFNAIPCLKSSVPAPETGSNDHRMNYAKQPTKYYPKILLDFQRIREKHFPENDSSSKVVQGVKFLGLLVSSGGLNTPNDIENEPEKAKSENSRPQRDGESEKARKLYPERGGEKYKSSWFDIMFKGEGREGIDKIRCERNVYSCITRSPLVKLMMKALRASGCPVDIRRHISCEVCDTSVTGGYDPYLNQVVVCQNTARSIGMIQGVLTHEMIHMFDFCRHKLDLTNVKHLACTEIRAANLAHCSYLSAFFQGTTSIFAVKRYHQYCVKKRAFDSVKAVMDVTDEEAWAAVETVFDKCYADLEPIGRRIRRNSDHMERAYADAASAGYD